jgi:hypothetical protein
MSLIYKGRKAVSLLIWLLVAAWVGSAAGQAQAALPAPGSFEGQACEPEAATGSSVSQPVAVSSSPLDLPPLKAVLVVGPIDGDTGPHTLHEMANMDLAAAELEANGVTVHKFYPPNSDWDEIVVAAEGAQFFSYRGHGVYWTSLPNPVVGGFALNDGLVAPDQIRHELKLARNAVVMLYGCFTAGSTIWNGEFVTISADEAYRRVAQYSTPFFDIGAGAYYANWYGDAYQMLVRSLFQGMTLGQAYESLQDFNPLTVERYMHPDHPALVMWLDKDFWSDTWQYNNAFAGLRDLTLETLFGPPQVAITPHTVATLAEPETSERTFGMYIGSTSSVTFHWTITPTTANEAWFDVQPLAGSSGERVTVTFRPTGLPLGSYSAGLKIVADDPTLANYEQTIPISLQVVEQVHSAYLPLIVSATPR